MRAVAVVVALAALASCHRTESCSPGSVLLTLDVPAGSDQLSIETDIDGTPTSSQVVTLPAGTTHGTVELDFSNYPAGRSIVITVVVIGGGTTLGSGSTGAHTLASSCDAFALTIDGTNSEDMSASDMTVGGGDLSTICKPGDKTCASGMLSTCNLAGTGYLSSTCALGCNASGSDCRELQPTAPAVVSDFVYSGLSDLTIATSQKLLIFDTDSGAITDDAGVTVRMANPTASMRYVENGIGFHVVSGVGIWTFSRLTVPSTTLVVFSGAAAASFLSPGDISIAGTIDLRGYADPTKALITPSTLCNGRMAGPGGTAGGIGGSSTAGGGSGGGGKPAGSSAGGGGGGYGNPGAAGGMDTSGGVAGGAAGSVSGDSAINPVVGGFGGGSSGGYGGGGGGALQIASEGTITISGTINAGGCGGGPGASAGNGAGGGGSGGAVLVEAISVHITGVAILAANGGGGGCGGSATGVAGDPGQASASSQANGGAGCGTGSHNGGFGDIVGASATPGSNGPGAGGGGGAVGRIRLNAASAPTIDSGAQVSPVQTAGTVVIQ